jgi:hypothetical protein
LGLFKQHRGLLFCCCVPGLLFLLCFSAGRAAMRQEVVRGGFFMTAAVTRVAAVVWLPSCSEFQALCYNRFVTSFELSCSWARAAVLQAVGAGVALIVLSLYD